MRKCAATRWRQAAVIFKEGAMQIDLIGKLASAALTLIVTLIQRRTAGKPRLLVWGPQPASYAIPNRPPPPTESDSGAAPVPATQPFPAVINLHSTTTAIQNVGGRQATAIQIAFPLRPRALRIEPPLKYEESTLPGGEYLVELSTLAPKEWIAVNALWEGFSFLPIYVRSAAGPSVA